MLYISRGSQILMPSIPQSPEFNSRVSNHALYEQHETCTTPAASIVPGEQLPVNTTSVGDGREEKDGG